MEISYFSITKVLREINLGDARSARCAILTQLVALNFGNYQFLQFWSLKDCHFHAFQQLKILDILVICNTFKCAIFSKNKNSEPREKPKLQFCETLHLLNLISRKNLNGSKIAKFSHCSLVALFV